MMTKLDRQLQSDILHQLLAVFPQLHDFERDDRFNGDRDKLIANLYYLQQHELISADTVKINQTLGSGFRPMLLNPSEITHKGIDFILDDGGLTAILSILTVRLDDEQFKRLFAEQISNSPTLDDSQKQGYLQTLRELPNEATKHLLTRLLDLGIDNIKTLFG